MDKASRIISGTWGEVWLDGVYVAEADGLQAKVSFNREQIRQCRKLTSGRKLMSIEGTGSLSCKSRNISHVVCYVVWRREGSG